MDVTFSERMLQRSHCFVAIVPDRSFDSLISTDDARLAWSPYQALEYRLAVRTNKPRLIIVEYNIDQGPLHEEPCLWFKRDTNSLSPEFDKDVKTLIAYIRSCARLETRAGAVKRQPTIPQVGILRWHPTERIWEQFTDCIKRLLKERFGTNCTYVEADELAHDHRVISEARELSLVIADLNPAITPPSLIGLLHGVGIPLYRTCLVGDKEDQKLWKRRLGLIDSGASVYASATENVSTHLLTGYQVDERMRPVMFWNAKSISPVADIIVQTIGEYRHRERRLKEEQSGRNYFLNQQGHRVFISTPGDISDLSKRIKVVLDDAGMPAFHYQLSIIEGGLSWKSQLEEHIKTSDVFVAFVTSSYWDRRECMDEMALAIDRWERHELLIVLYAEYPLPPIPPFLQRLQINRISTSTETSARIVNELRDRLSDGAREPIKDITALLVELVSRHVPLLEKTPFSDWVRQTCDLQSHEAQAIVDRVFAVDKPNRAKALVASLLNAIQGERYRGQALGSVCYFLRKLEYAPPKRNQLSTLFSTLRLFPKLHDLRTWDARRKRSEVLVQLKPEAPKELLIQLVRASSGQDMAMATVRSIGAEIARHIEIDNQDSLLKQPHTRVCVLSGVEHLMVPIEWAVLNQLEAPLSRARVVFRRVGYLGYTSLRETMESAFHNGVTGPPRILLFGFNAPSLQYVTTELRALQTLLIERYEEAGWPSSLIRCIPSNDASRDQLAMELAGSDYEILHLAGEAGYDAAGRPVIQVADPAGKAPAVTGEEIGEWLRTSSVRLVYLSCCEGAATSTSVEHQTGWKQSLCKEILEAGIPEVFAHFWPVSDARSVAFSKAFYSAYFPTFDAPVAVYKARNDSGRSNTLWASSVFIQQAQS